MARRTYVVRLKKGKTGWRVRVGAPNGRIIESAAGQQYSRTTDAINTLKHLAVAVVEGRIVVEKV